MTLPSDRTLNWHVESVGMYLFNTGWFTVTLVRVGGGGPQDGDPERIRYVTNTPPPVGSVVRIAVEIWECT